MSPYDSAVLRIVSFLQRTLLRPLFIYQVGTKVDCVAGRKLNVGCGLVPKTDDSWTFVDVASASTADVILDLELPLPLAPSSFDYVLLGNVIEHIHDLVGLMASLYGLLKPGGYLEILCPHASDAWAWGDPTHVRGISEHTIEYFANRWDLSKVYGLAPFRLAYLRADRRYRGSGIHAILQKPAGGVFGEAQA